MSVANWIRLSRVEDVRSSQRQYCVVVRVAALLSLSGGWLATSTAESSRLLSLPDGKEIEYAGIPPASRGPLGYPPVEALLFGLLHAYTRLNGARLPVHRYPDAFPVLGNPKTSTARVGRSYESL